MHITRLRASIMLAAIVAAACGDSVTPTQETPVPASNAQASWWRNQPPTASISAPSASASVTQGSAITFSGSGYDPERGTLTGTALQWTSNRDGNIGSGTSFSKSNLSVGTHTITLTASDMRGSTGTASRTLTVSAPVTVVNQAPIARFAVSCALLVCSVDASQSSDDAGITQYSWNWGNGQSLVASALSSVTYLLDGTYTISLTVRDAAGLTGTTTQTVTVAGAVAAPPPPPSGSGNEPSGMSVLSDRAFNCVTDGCEGWAAKTNLANTLLSMQDASAPRSGAYVGRIMFPAGATGGDSFSRTCRDFSATEQKKTLYVSAWIELSSNFQGHPNSFINKIFYAYLNNYGTDVALEAWGGNSDPLVHGIVMQNLAAAYPDSYGGPGANTVSRTRNVNTTLDISRGAWHKLEYVLTANTPGVADGSIDAWEDGVKIHSHTGIMFTPAGGNSKWEKFCFDPIWGGVGGTVSSTFWMQADHIYISGK